MCVCLSVCVCGLCVCGLCVCVCVSYLCLSVGVCARVGHTRGREGAGGQKETVFRDLGYLLTFFPSSFACFFLPFLFTSVCYTDPFLVSFFYVPMDGFL